jgi:phenylacetate-CoA ligase
VSRTYFEALDSARLADEYPIGAAFIDRYTGMSRDELRDLQEHRFQRTMARAWKVPFYQRLWSARGIEAGDIRRLDDLDRLPTYDKSDLMASVEAHPPLGDFSGRDSYPADERPPLILHTTSGTTGSPQPVMFGPWGREVANLLVGRMFRWQGVRDDDVVHSVYGHGLINGGHYLREAVTHFTGATFLSAGTGVETPSVRQVQVMHRFGATVLIGFVNYLRKLATVARDEGLEPGRDIPVRMIIGHLASDARSDIETAWGGAPAFDWYGVADTGTVAGEGPDRDGLYVWEDAHYLEIIDTDSGRPADVGETGDMVVTCLYKEDLFPIIRFNTHDVSSWLPGTGATGLAFRRIKGFLGRSDNMVKIRGINVFPHAIAPLLDGDPAATGEYYCRVVRDENGREDLVVTIEHRGGGAPAEYAAVVGQALGIAVQVDLVPPGATADITGLNRRQKPIRLVDER